MIDWDKIEELWRERHQPQRLEECEQILRQAPTEFEQQWRLARLAHFKAMQADENNQKATARAHFIEGRDWAVRACEEAPHQVESHFWLGVNMLEGAQHTNFLAAWHALKPAEESIRKAVATNEAYHFAGPLRVEARITHRKPLLMGGSVERALIVYRRALQISPDNSTTLYYYAEALLDDQQRRAARAALQQIVDGPDNPDWRWEQERDRRRALQLLQRTAKE